MFYFHLHLNFEITLRISSSPRDHLGDGENSFLLLFHLSDPRGKKSPKGHFIQINKLWIIYLLFVYKYMQPTLCSSDVNVIIIVLLTK